MTWTSSNTRIAKVSDNGCVTGVYTGTATITATSSTGVSASCTVTVRSAEVTATGIRFDNTTATVRVNEWTAITAMVTPANTSGKTCVYCDGESSICWYPKSDAVLEALNINPCYDEMTEEKAACFASFAVFSKVITSFFVYDNTVFLPCFLTVFRGRLPHFARKLSD